MRTSLRQRIVFVGVGMIGLAAWVACSGSSSQDVIQEDAGPPPAPPPPPQPPPPPPPPVDSGPVDSGPVYDAGPKNVLDGGDIYEGGVPCVVGGELEIEPNDEAGTANVLVNPPEHPTRCGAVLLTGDGGTAESDFLTFTLPTGTASFFLQWDGNISLKVDVDGSAPVTSPFEGGIPFHANTPYFVEVKSADGKKQFWRVSVFKN
jgi:hypothetical protein